MLTNAYVVDITNFKVVKGQKFSLITDLTEPKEFFSNKDAVLSIDDNGMTAEVEATDLGKSMIIILEPGGLTMLKTITIEVVDAIVLPATNLGVSADPAIPKS